MHLQLEVSSQPSSTDALRFQNGWLLSALDAAPILQELAHLRRHLTNVMPDAEITHHILARINVLMREMNDIQHSTDVDAFVGSVCPPPHRTLPIFRPEPFRAVNRLRIPL